MWNQTNHWNMYCIFGTCSEEHLAVAYDSTTKFCTKYSKCVSYTWCRGQIAQLQTISPGLWDLLSLRWTEELSLEGRWIEWWWDFAGGYGWIYGKWMNMRELVGRSPRFLWSFRFKGCMVMHKYFVPFGPENQLQESQQMTHVFVQTRVQ